MPIEISQAMISGRYGGDENKKDIHEADTEYLSHCRKAALAAAKEMNWNYVNCAADEYTPRSISSINDEIKKLITKLII